MHESRCWWADKTGYHHEFCIFLWITRFYDSTLHHTRIYHLWSCISPKEPFYQRGKHGDGAISVLLLSIWQTWFRKMGCGIQLERQWAGNGSNDNDYERQTTCSDHEFTGKYAEPYEWLLKEFTDWAFTFLSSFLYYQDLDKLDDMQKDLYRQGMATFGKIAPTIILNYWKSLPSYGISIRCCWQHR